MMLLLLPTLLGFIVTVLQPSNRIGCDSHLTLNADKKIYVQHMLYVALQQFTGLSVRRSSPNS